MSKIGTANIGGIMLGSTEVVKAYLGSDIVYQKSSPLPYDAEVEYLRFLVHAYIDTLVYANPSMRVVVSVKFNRINAQDALFRSGLSFWYGIYVNGNKRFAYTYKDDAGNFVATSITPNTSTNYLVDFNGVTKKLKINNSTINVTGSPATKTSTKTLPLMARIGGDGTVYTDNTDINLYYAQIYNNNVLVRDFIPVRVGDVGYLFDKISGQLFGNSGTGDIILGADKN